MNKKFLKGVRFISGVRFNGKGGRIGDRRNKKWMRDGEVVGDREYLELF